MLGLHGSGRAATLVAGDPQKIVGVGHFRIPLQHGPQLKHHVGQALNVGMLRLCDAVFQHRHVIAQPHVALVESGGVGEFGRGFVKLAVLDVVPGEDAVGERTADRVSGQEIGILPRSPLFSLRFEFLVRGSGRGSQRVQCLQANVAAFGNADFYIGVEGALVGLGQRLGRDGRVVWPHGSWESVHLVGSGRTCGVRIRLPGVVKCGEKRGLRMKIFLHRLFQLRGTHAVGLLNGVFHRDMLVEDQIEVGASLGQLFLVKQVVHHDPRLGIVERVVRALVARRGIVLHGEEVGQGQPDLGA